MTELDRKRREFASKLALLKDEAGRLELWNTMQMLDNPLTMVGYEIAGTPQKYYLAKREFARAVRRIQRGTHEAVQSKGC